MTDLMFLQSFVSFDCCTSPLKVILLQFLLENLGFYICHLLRNLYVFDLFVIKFVWKEQLLKKEKSSEHWSASWSPTGFLYRYGSCAAGCTQTSPPTQSPWEFLWQLTCNVWASVLYCPSIGPNTIVQAGIHWHGWSPPSSSSVHFIFSWS